MMLKFILALCLSAHFAIAFSDRKIDLTKEAESDRVSSLPGAKDLDFDLYAGYITVDKDAGRALFYTLAESTSDQPDKDPLVWFLNGGPGCSSLGGGFLSELGPFYPTPNGHILVKNEYRWNQISNMLFVDNPAFVGFSYSNTSTDIATGDEPTAEDSYRFLLNFLERFPKYKDKPLWLAGESYAGHYIPNLALKIVQGNRNTDNRHKVNFKGFLLGNPLTLPKVDSAGALRFWFTHGIISEEAYHGAVKYCNLADTYPLNSAAETTPPQPASISTFRRSLKMSFENTVGSESGLFVETAANDFDEEKCDKYVELAMHEMEGINIYDIYADVCIPEAEARLRQLALAAGQGAPAAGSNAVRPAAGLAFRAALNQPRYDPCIDNEVEVYMNRPDVQAALHANQSSTGHYQPDRPWVTCNSEIQYSRDDVLSSMIPVYEQLLEERELSMLLYSGDIDAILPVIGTRKWIRDLDLEVADEWRSWKSTTGQIGGWTVGYKGLTFASVRGAGHMVPYTQPERAFYMFSRWVHGKPL